MYIRKLCENPVVIAHLFIFSSLLIPYGFRTVSTLNANLLRPTAFRATYGKKDTLQAYAQREHDTRACNFTKIYGKEHTLTKYRSVRVLHMDS